MTNQIK